MYSPTLAPISLQLSQLPCFLPALLCSSLPFRKRRKATLQLFLQFLSSFWTAYTKFACISIPKGFCGSPFLWFLVASVFEKHTNFSAEMALQPSFALLVILTPSWKQVDFPRLKMKKTKCQALKNSCGQCKYEKPTSYSKVLFWKSSSNYVFTVCWLLRQNSIEDATTTSWAVFWPIILKLLN